MSLITKLITGQVISTSDIKSELCEICDREHSSCNEDCPVFANMTTIERNDPDFCQCHKDGKKMLEFIINRTQN